jgi:hypothetical protein
MTGCSEVSAWFARSKIRVDGFGSADFLEPGRHWLRIQLP